MKTPFDPTKNMADGNVFTEDQLAAMKHPPLAKRIRRTLGLSQDAFSERFGIPLRTLQEWEQGRREPDAATASYLRVIEREPDVVARVLAVE